VKRFLPFVLFWFILNLIQSALTEIIDDEAYYWVYSQFLDWGYFDHPPMIAWLIRIGSTLLPGELGVRLMPSLLGAGTIFLTFLMLKDQVRKPGLLMLVLSSIPLFHANVAGFIATPDLPLVFFATLFLFLYKRYLENETVLTVLLLGLSIALMLYSKYHALLIIGFTLLSNPMILKRRSFWLMTLFASVLYLPHIVWQFKHHFVSFGYHLIDRNNPFEMKFLFEYIGNQLLMIGPFCGVLLIYFSFTHKTLDKFEAALKFNLIGVFLFFMVSSLRGHVEPHWTAAAFVPMVLLSYPEIEKRISLRKWITIAGGISIGIILILRLIIIEDFGLMPETVRHRFLHKKEAFQQIQKEARGRDVVFTNSYKRTSLYWFFNQEKAFSHNDIYSRKNQYDLMDQEASLQGKEVLYFSGTTFPGCDTLETSMGNFIMSDTEHFCHFNRVEIKLPQMEGEFKPGEKVDLQIELSNPTSSTVRFCDSCTHKPRLISTYFSENGYDLGHFVNSPNPLPDLAPGERVVYPVQIQVPNFSGKFQLVISLGSDHLRGGINGRPVTMSVHARSKKNSLYN
jgi:hypothetical protein